METELTGREAVDYIKNKMWHHVPNATCMKCKENKNVGRRVFKQLGGALLCEDCVIIALILNGATAEELKSEKREADSEK